jgi:hypothetical protein
MKRTLMVLAVVLTCGAAYAADEAFGVPYGEPVPISLHGKDVGDRTIRLSRVPSPYPDIDVYAATVDAEGRVCAVTGYIPAAEQKKVEGKIAEIYLRMNEVYGHPMNARPGEDVNEAWLWFNADKSESIVLRRFLGPKFTRAASLEFFRVGSTCK